MSFCRRSFACALACAAIMLCITPRAALAEYVTLADNEWYFCGNATVDDLMHLDQRYDLFFEQAFWTVDLGGNNSYYDSVTRTSLPGVWMSNYSLPNSASSNPYYGSLVHDFPFGLGDEGSNVLLDYPRYMSFVYFTSYGNEGYYSLTGFRNSPYASDLRFYVHELGVSSWDDSAYDRLLPNSDGSFTLPYTIDAFVIRYLPSYSGSCLSQFNSTVQSVGTGKIHACFFSMPTIAVWYGDEQDLTSVVEYLDSIDSNIQTQTDVLMSTTGGGDIASDIVGDYSPNDLNVGVFGQVQEFNGTIIDTLTTTEQISTVPFPGISVLGQTLVPAQDVDIWQGGLRTFRTPIKYITSFMFIIAFIRGVRWIIEVQILDYRTNKEDEK